MLSINIPVYNIEVRDLVLELVRQGNGLDIPYEIRVYDDGSEERIKQANRILQSEKCVIYKELPENVGRAAIRNKMGEEAGYNKLLFIDADSEILSENYLKKYLDLNTSGIVFCGGTEYSPKKPIQKTQLLRWKYGTKREAISAEKRNAAKGFIITSNNFLIEKDTFIRIPFREELKGYGHEDTLLGYDLHQDGVRIQHIDNPVMHTGLEDAQVFLAKTKTAINNLDVIVYQLLKDKTAFEEQVAFLRKYKKIKRFIPSGIFKTIYKIGHRFFEKNLVGRSPSLFLFDLYKLTYYSNIKNR